MKQNIEINVNVSHPAKKERIAPAVDMKQVNEKSDLLVNRKVVLGKILLKSFTF